MFSLFYLFCVLSAVAAVSVPRSKCPLVPAAASQFHQLISSGDVEKYSKWLYDPAKYVLLITTATVHKTQVDQNHTNVNSDHITKLYMAKDLPAEVTKTKSVTEKAKCNKDQHVECDSDNATITQSYSFANVNVTYTANWKLNSGEWKIVFEKVLGVTENDRDLPISFYSFDCLANN